MVGLSNYQKILEGKSKPKFKQNENKLQKTISKAKTIMQKCEFCERKCKVNRLKGELGFCRAIKDWNIMGAHTHMGEEVELIPSATIFLSGCTMRCCYCQNAPESIDPDLGEIWKEKEVRDWIDLKYKKGCINVNFVTPDCYVWNILKVLKSVTSPIPVVWNSSSYYSKKTAMLIKDFVDVYLLDFRYFNNKCAKKLSQAPKYVEAAKRNFLIAKENGELLIRVLILPNHIECCIKPILKWIKVNLGENIRVNILSKYYPTWNADKVSKINRGLKLKEYKTVVTYAKKIGLKNL